MSSIPVNKDIEEAYGLLGLQSKDGGQAARKRFLRLALIHHPDKGGDKELMQKITKAYKSIQKYEEEKRNYFDEFLDAETKAKLEELRRQLHLQKEINKKLLERNARTRARFAVGSE